MNELWLLFSEVKTCHTVKFKTKYMSVFLTINKNNSISHNGNTRTITTPAFTAGC